MPLGLRSVLLVAAVGSSLAVAVGQGACVVPPAELQPQPLMRPTILRGSVTPSPDEPLPSWTSATEFIVPVELDDVNQVWVWSLFIDYNGDPSSRAALISQAPMSLPQALDGGVYPLVLRVDPTLTMQDLTLCHWITLLVGHGFQMAPSGPLYGAFDGVGPDTVTWFWLPPGLSSCKQFSGDAGATGSADASNDSLPVAPGGDP